MSISFNKEIIEKIQQRILAEFPPEENDGIPAGMSFTRIIDSLRMPQAGMRNIRTIGQAISAWIQDGGILPYNYDRAKFLNNLGLNKYDAEKIADWKDSELIEMNNLFIHLIIRDGTKLYEKLIKQLEEIP